MSLTISNQAGCILIEWYEQPDLLYNLIHNQWVCAGEAGVVGGSCRREL